MAFSSVLGASSVVKPGVVTTATRPSSPFVGQMIYDTTVATLLIWSGTAWNGLVAASATTYTATQQTVIGASYQDCATVTAVTITTGTSALVVASGDMIGDANNAEVYMSFAVSGATTIAASDTWAAHTRQGTSAYFIGSYSTIFKVVDNLTAGSNTFTMKFKNSGSTSYHAFRRITVFPL